MTTTTNHRLQQSQQIKKRTKVSGNDDDDDVNERKTSDDEPQCRWWAAAERAAVRRRRRWTSSRAGHGSWRPGTERCPTLLPFLGGNRRSTDRRPATRVVKKSTAIRWIEMQMFAMSDRSLIQRSAVEQKEKKNNSRTARCFNESFIPTSRPDTCSARNSSESPADCCRPVQRSARPWMARRFRRLLHAFRRTPPTTFTIVFVSKVVSDRQRITSSLRPLIDRRNPSPWWHCTRRIPPGESKGLNKATEIKKSFETTRPQNKDESCGGTMCFRGRPSATGTLMNGTRLSGSWT